MLSRKMVFLLVPMVVFAASAYAAGSAAKGKQVYMANCIACHNMDPSKPGALGPEIKGSSLNLLQLRVTKGVYPKGYKPKRATKLMMALPHLAASVADLAAYLK